MSLNIKGGSFLIQEVALTDIFIPEEFTSEQLAFKKTAEDFAIKEVNPKNKDLEEQKMDILIALLKKSGELGLTAVDIPEKYDGLGQDKITSCLVSEALSQGSAFVVSFSAHSGIGTFPIIMYGNEEQKQKYLPKLASCEIISSYALTEPNAGSDALAGITNAKLSPDKKNYIINGEKTFITNAGISDLMVVYAKINGDDFMSAFIVEKKFKGISVGNEEEKMGLHGSSTCSLSFDDAVVPKENLLGEQGKGHHVAFNTLNYGRLKLGSACVGTAKFIIDKTVNYAKTRKQFSANICEFGAIKEKLASMYIKTFASESVVYRTAKLYDLAIANVPKDDLKMLDHAMGEFAIEAAVVKVFTSEALDFICDEAIQIHGGYGFIKEYEIERIFRDQRVNRIFEGTNEINRLLIIINLLKKAQKGDLPILEKIKDITEELMSFSEEPESTDILSDEIRLIKNFKKISIMMAGTAFQKYGDDLINEQEILMRLSNIIINIFTNESVIARTLKLIEKDGEEKSEIPIAISKVLVYELGNDIHAQGREAFCHINKGDDLRTSLSALRRLLKIKEYPDLIGLKQKVAEYLISR